MAHFQEGQLILDSRWWRHDCESAEVLRFVEVATLSKNIALDTSVNIGQSTVSSLMSIGQACVVEAQQLKRSCVQIVDVHRIASE